MELGRNNLRISNQLAGKEMFFPVGYFGDSIRRTLNVHAPGPISLWIATPSGSDTGRKTCIASRSIIAKMNRRVNNY